VGTQETVHSHYLEKEGKKGARFHFPYLREGKGKSEVGKRGPSISPIRGEKESQGGRDSHSSKERKITIPLSIGYEMVRGGEL